MINAATKNTNLCWQHMKIMVKYDGTPDGEAGVDTFCRYWVFAGPTWHIVTDGGIIITGQMTPGRNSWSYRVREFSTSVFHNLVSHFVLLGYIISIYEKEKSS